MGAVSAWPWAAAQALPQPQGPLVLSVGGQIGQVNHAERAVFDMAMLAQLPQHTIETRTPWYPSARRFTGPLVREVLQQVQARGNQLRAIALNDYEVIIPVEDVMRHDVVVARLLDGQPMAVRDKGPLFVIYPFDSAEALRRTLYYSRCIWQLKAIEVQ